VRVDDLVAVLPLLKINQLGLQYHQFSHPRTKEKMLELAKKYSSKNPMPPFMTTVQRGCRAAQSNENLDTIVYYSPFHGDNYFDFSKAEDRKGYLDMLLRFVGMGAAGVVIDYNDWVFSGIWGDGRGKKMPMDEVVRYIYAGIKAKHPATLVFWTPPSRYRVNENEEWGYRGEVTPHYAKILQSLPRDVQVFWTGPSTANALIATQIKQSAIESWIRGAGRKPFLWINVGSGGGDFFGHLSLDLGPDALLPAVEKLPRNMRRYFSGVHLNYSVYRRKDSNAFTRDQFNIHGAATADYLWNPAAWDEINAYKRAKCFVSVMYPLLQREQEVK